MNNPINTKKFYFKRKRYGWGWTPVTWQGWLIIVVFLLPLFWVSRSLPADPSNSQLSQFFITIGSLIGVTILVIARLSPAPRWRWGKKDTDSPDEDF